MVDYLQEGRMMTDVYHLEELRQAIVKKEENSLLEALARSCTSTHLSSCYGSLRKHAYFKYTENFTSKN